MDSRAPTLTRMHAAPPEEDQPHPSQDLLEGHFKGETELAGLPDVNHKVSFDAERDRAVRGFGQRRAGFGA